MVDGKFNRLDESIKATRRFEYNLLRLEGFPCQVAVRVRDWRSSKVLLFIENNHKMKGGNKING